MKRERVAILGYVEETLWQAPFEDKTWRREDGSEIWGLNDLWQLQTKAKRSSLWGQMRWDRWFEMHTLGKSEPKHIDWLKHCGVSIYMTKHYDNIPPSIAYPLDEMMKRFQTRYFTNTISYELALAISEGFKEIHLYGVNMAAVDNEGPSELGAQ